MSTAPLIRSSTTEAVTRRLRRAALRGVLVLGALLGAFGALERSAAAWCSPMAVGCACNGGHPCGGALSCVGGFCTAAACAPKTCATLAPAANCGTPDNGCGTALASCGSCLVAGETCGGGGVANVCGACVPLLACPVGKVCGTYADGCGSFLSCGTCGAGSVCKSDNTCGVCTPNTCAGLGKNCGSVDDGCGGTLPCGSCTAPDTCGGGGSVNVCGNGTRAPTPFGAGSLIVPMDNCYNPDYTANTGPQNSGAACVAASAAYACYAGTGYPGGNVRLPFGLLYLMAVNNIPIHVILNPQKSALSDADFTVTPPVGSTTQTSSVLSYTAASKTFAVNAAGMKCNTNTVYYAGMPFVIDAPYASQALQLIANFNAGEFAVLPLHIANYPFTAPVIGTLSTRPKPVLVDGAPLDTFFTESGIPDVVSNTYLTVTRAGAAWTYSWPTSLGTIPVTTPGCAAASGGFQLCNALTYSAAGVNKRIVDVLWNHDGDLNLWAGIGKFFQSDGSVMTLADASDFEGAYTASEGGRLGGTLAVVRNGAEKGPFCAASPTGAASTYTSLGSSTDYPASDNFLQLGSMDIFIKGGGGGDGSSYKFSSAPVSKTHALTNGGGVSAIAGHPEVGGVQTTGDLVYVASLNSWHGGAAGKDGGLRIMYNSLIAGGDASCGHSACVTSEYSRATPVTGAYGEHYRGTFDWQAPPDTNPGTFLYTPPSGTYPYSRGHFREYKAALANTVAGGNTSVPTTLTSYALGLACDPTAATSPCNWDAASLMKPYAQRNVFVVTPSTTTLVAASTAATPVGWATVNTALASKLTNGASGVLGGIDYATAAVIEAKPTGNVTVAGATTRPTIGYVGGRDGMLHAFCIKPGTSDLNDRCYGTATVGSGFARGEEIWAIIPPGIQNAMITANASGDWSKINVGGAVRVADLKDSFIGESASSSYRTILIVGSRDLGFINAFDVSNPNPVNKNTDGFRYLWENNGTVATAGTPPAMGQTMGATVGLTDSVNAAGVALVTANKLTGNGINTYGMRVSDGKVFAYETRAYTLSVPLAGGTSALVPNDLPPLATITDVNADGNDDTAFVVDFEGGVQKISFSGTAFISSAQAYNMSTSALGCGVGKACQPIGGSASLVNRGGTKVGVVVITGGSDVARSFSNSSFYVGGFDSATNTQLFTPLPVGSLATLPAGPVPAGGMPLRSYAPLSITGTAMFADTTTLAINTMAQLIQPGLVPGQYGDVRRWDNVNAAPSGAITALASGNTYSGGFGAILEINSSTGGVLVSVGTTQTLVVSLSSTDSALANAAYHVGSSGSVTGRNFSTKGWFDLSN